MLFRLDECKFLKPRVEYVSHDILYHSNCPAQSKFNLIDDWTLLTSGQSLFSFIGLVNFYHRHAPYMESRLKSLRKMVNKFYGKPIPLLAWSPDLTKFFNDFKRCITTSLVLFRFDLLKLTFLKIDWSNKGMDWIRMKPADDDEYFKAVINLKAIE